MTIPAIDPAVVVEPTEQVTPDPAESTDPPTTTVTPADVAAQVNTGGGEVTPQVPEFKPITSQEEFDRRIGKRIGEIEAKYPNYEDLKAKAAKYDDYERSQLSEKQQAELALQELRDQVAAFEREKQERDFSDLRNGVARAKGLPEALASRLTGTTQEELEADAEALLQLVPKQPTPVATPTPGAVGGGAPEATTFTNAEPDADFVKNLMIRGRV